MTKPENRAKDEDRRKRPTPVVSEHLFRGKRRGPRRDTDPRVNYYVDRPHRAAWQHAVLLICLSLLDAFLSLWLFSDGRSNELNPLLIVGLKYGNWVFLGMKLALTLFSSLFLLLHWNFRIGTLRISVVRLVQVLICLYLVIVGYELVLLFAWR